MVVKSGIANHFKGEKRMWMSGWETSGVWNWYTGHPVPDDWPFAYFDHSCVNLHIEGPSIFIHDFKFSDRIKIIICE